MSIPTQYSSLATRSAAVQTLVLQPGQVVEGKVQGTGPNGTTQVQVGRQTINLTLPVLLATGSTVNLQAQGSGAQQRLVMVPPTTQSAPLPQPSPNAGTPQQSPAPQPGSPQAALAQMVQTSVQRQGSVANLTSMLASVVEKGQLPQPVLQAAQQILAASLPLGRALTGAAMQRAIANSGIFQEAALLQGAPQQAKGDLKTALLTLRATLVTWLGQNAAVVTPPGHLPPPMRGALPRARPASAGQPDIPETPIEVGKVMLGRADASLARLRLHQHASLPETTVAGAKADWSTDIPVMIGTHQTVMQLQIHRDATGGEQAMSERGWQMNFAVDLPQLGEVGAQVGLRGGITSVRLWATNPETAKRLEQAAPELGVALEAAGLRPGIVTARGAEPVQSRVPSGRFVNSLT